MKKGILNKMAVVVLTASLTLGGGVAVAQAATFGNRSSGASTQEVFQIKYNGAAWNYQQSPYKNTWFRYSRGGKTLLRKTATNGKVTGTVWDSLIPGESHTTKFAWGRGPLKK